MFVACDGLSIIPIFLASDYATCKDLLYICIDCVSCLFRMQEREAIIKRYHTTPRNQYFRLFLNVNLVERLSKVLVSMLSIKPGEQQEQEIQKGYILQASDILKLFSTGDSLVKTRICTPEIIGSTVSFKMSHC